MDPIAQAKAARRSAKWRLPAQPWPTPHDGRQALTLLHREEQLPKPNCRPALLQHVRSPRSREQTPGLRTQRDDRQLQPRSLPLWPGACEAISRPGSRSRHSQAKASTPRPQAQGRPAQTDLSKQRRILSSRKDALAQPAEASHRNHLTSITPCCVHHTSWWTQHGQNHQTKTGDSKSALT